MIKYKSLERKVDMYDIGDGLTLMNIIQENQDGQIQSVDTYIGAEKGWILLCWSCRRIRPTGSDF